MRKLYSVMFVMVLLSLLINIASVSALSAVVYVPEKYTDVQAGERFYFEMNIKYPENPSRSDLRLNYEILNEEGEVIAQSKVLKAIETQASFIDFIVIPESADTGLHIIKVNIADYEDLSEEVEASFHVISGGAQQLRLYFFILLGVLILVGALVMINIVLSRRRKV